MCRIEDDRHGQSFEARLKIIKKRFANSQKELTCHRKVDVFMRLPIVILRALHNHQMGGHVDAPCEGGRCDQQLDLLLNKELENNLLEKQVFDI